MSANKTAGSLRASAPSNPRIENRRIRNRISQRASRERQAIYIKELEKRLSHFAKSETDRNAALEDENKLLRKQLFDGHKKLESVLATLKGLSDSAAAVLRLEASEVEAAPTTNKGAANPDYNILSPFSSQDFDLSGFEGLPPEPEIVTMVSPPTFNSPKEIMPSLGDHSNAFKTQIPNGLELPASNKRHEPAVADPPLERPSSTIPSMDFPRLQCFWSQAVFGLDVPALRKRGTKSFMSDHITTLEHFMRQKFIGSRLLSDQEARSLTKCASFMVSVFVGLSWQSMTTWYAYTRCHIHLAKVTMWRLNPTQTTYTALPEFYRPTRTQLSVTHPPAIDWIPFPSVRDKLILYHSANPMLDSLICEISEAYVVETDLSRLLAGLEPTTGYVGVWDLVRAMALDGAESEFEEPPGGLRDWSDFAGQVALPEDSSQIYAVQDLDEAVDMSGWTPATSVEDLFGCKKRAQQAFKLLGMDRGAINFRLNPDLFRRHAELFDPEGDTIAHGLYLKPVDQKAMPTPQRLDISCVARYQELATWTYDISSEAPPAMAPTYNTIYNRDTALPLQVAC